MANLKKKKAAKRIKSGVTRAAKDWARTVSNPLAIPKDFLYHKDTVKEIAKAAKRVVVGSPAYRSIEQSLNEKTGQEKKKTKRKKVFNKKNKKPRTDILRRY